EFLRRFLLHVVPPGFVRIRHFGLLANRTRQAKLTRCRQLLAVAAAAATSLLPASPSDTPSPRRGASPRAPGPPSPLLPGSLFFLGPRSAAPPALVCPGPPRRSSYLP